MESFLFDVTGLDDEAWTVDTALTGLRSAAEGRGHQVAEGEPIGGWRVLDLDGPLPSATIMVFGGRPAWAFSIDDGVLGGEFEPVEATQAALVDLLGACVAAAPLYLGTAVWPFGPQTPPSYDTGKPFVAEQAGPLMYVSDAYVDAILDGKLDPPRGWTSTPAGPGRLLVTEGNLLLQPEDAAPQRLLKRLRPRR